MSNQRGPLPGATGSGRPPRGDPRRAQAAAASAPGAEIAVPGFANIPRTGQSIRPDPPECPSGLSTGTGALWAILFTSCPWLDVEKDLTAVEQLCRLVDDIASCRQAIDEHGLLISECVQTAAGKIIEGERRLVVNPASTALDKYLRHLETMMAALGIQPQARARLGIDVAQLRRSTTK